MEMEMNFFFRNDGDELAPRGEEEMGWKKILKEKKKWLEYTLVDLLKASDKNKKMKRIRQICDE
jgi:hypothetical protein